MPDLKIRQLQYESDTWKRLLGFIVEENVRLKNRLSEVLQDKFDKSLLEEVENFQTKFVKEDELVFLLRNDVAEYDKLLTRASFENGSLYCEIDNKLKKLRSTMPDAENQFGKLKSDFNSYLSENI